MTTERVPFLSLKAAYLELKPSIDEAVARVLNSGWYILGPEVEEFETSFARYVGAKHCIGVGNGLDAITLALKAHGIGAGDEVLVPSNTFVATWLGVHHAGATPVPVEPDPATHLVSAESLERAITPHTAAMMPVHLYGLPADLPAIHGLCAKRSLLLIDDAAQAHGARVGGTRVGGFGNTTTWSFYPGKNLGALGDAGAITTNDDALALRLRRLRNYGSSVKYVHDEVGLNSRLDPIQAAVLRVKLAHLESWNERREAVAALYSNGLSGIASLELPIVPPDRTHAWHLYVLRTSRRDALRAFLDARGIGTLIHYPKPPHRQAAFAAFDSAPLRIAERLSSEVLSLPMGPHLGAEDVELVISAVREFFADDAISNRHFSEAATP